jgi:DNA-binding CsgD family transcriptional regulator
MIEGLNKETLYKLYIKEGKSTYGIAKMYGCTTMTVWTRCKKYGIKTRPRWESVKIKKSVLQKLYVKEGKSLEKIANILSCSPHTVGKRCREYGIEIRVKRFKKSLLKKLYVTESKSTREIAKLLSCSRGTVVKRCKQLGIPLRPPGQRRVDIDKPTLRRLYIKEGKTFTEIAKIYNCSFWTISNKVKRFGLKMEKINPTN